jgi:hypothetical protein
VIFLVFLLGIALNVASPDVGTTGAGCKDMLPSTLANAMPRFTRDLNLNSGQQEQIEAIRFQNRAIRAARRLILRPEEGRLFR